MCVCVYVCVYVCVCVCVCVFIYIYIYIYLAQENDALRTQVEQLEHKVKGSAGKHSEKCSLHSDCIVNTLGR